MNILINTSQTMYKKKVTIINNYTNEWVVEMHIYYFLKIDRIIYNYLSYLMTVKYLKTEKINLCC